MNKVPVSNYRLRLETAATEVAAGNRGEISHTRFFVDNYTAECYEAISSYLDHPNPAVRAEAVLLFSRLGIRKVADRIKEMSYRDADVVVGACVAYEKGIEDADSRIPGLLYTANHDNGPDFATAVRTLGGIAVERDIPEIRRVYGQVEGNQREMVYEALSRIIDRDPDLERKRDFILSVPLYPNEDSYDSFLSKSIRYLDERYRANVLPRTSISIKMRNDVVHAILTMQIRIYNERANMDCYSVDTVAMTEDLEDLIAWAADDLNSKSVIRS